MPFDLPARPSSRAAPEPSAPDSAASIRVDPNPWGGLIQRLSERRQIFGRYKVEDQVAQGGMGAILRVQDVDLRRQLAMKVVLERGGGRPREQRLIARFAEEAQITGQLEHPGIVPVHDLGLDDQGRMFFTMRLVRGRDFEQILGLVHSGQDEEWTLTRAVDVLLKVCEAMAYAHSKRVIHRDLKPANVMVGRFGEVYVMDWGLARVLDRASDSDSDSELVPQTFAMPRLTVRTDREDARESGAGSALMTMVGDVMGTPTHMSPEQARGDLAAMGPASDIYSAGAILYHLLAGHAPFCEPGASPNAAAVWKRVRAGPPEPIEQRAPSAPPELCAICERAMARAIGDRYPSMKALARDLRAYLEGRVVGAYETGAVAEFRKWVSRNKALALTSLTACTVIVSGLTVASLVLARKNNQLSTLTAEAVASAELAEERATKVLRLSDVKRVQQLVDQADALWPAHPRNSPALRAWLEGARDLLGREQLHLDELERLRGAAGAPQDAGGDPAFTGTEDQWQHDTLVGLTTDLARLRDPDVGLVADVEARLRFAESVEQRTRTGPAARTLWAEALAALADAGTSPAYAGGTITPQLGLLPLGPDPRSGLWEFAHLQTGTAPVRGPDGQLELTEESGVVLVLLPGGSFRRGEPSGPQGDEPFEPGTLEVELAPFFISKYELTQGQWLRFTGENPSRYGPGTEFDGRQVDLLDPVEQVSWFDCRDVLAKLALELPTEAQWEYAARASTDGSWWTGSERESLRGRANLADRSAARIGARWAAISDWPDLDDGHAIHAPVNAFEPNPFGLFNVAGNVWEWCSDPYAPGYGSEVSALHTWRGGSFQHAASLARSSYRSPTSPDVRHFSAGVRPARAVDP